MAKAAAKRRTFRHRRKSRDCDDVTRKDLG
jgi:hypothetical protein